MSLIVQNSKITFILLSLGYSVHWNCFDIETRIKMFFSLSLFVSRGWMWKAKFQSFLKYWKTMIFRILWTSLMQPKVMYSLMAITECTKFILFYADICVHTIRAKLKLSIIYWITFGQFHWGTFTGVYLHLIICFVLAWNFNK